MAFTVYGTQESSSSKKSDVNFDEINKYLVEAAGLEDRETLVGVVSMIVDLGTQKQPDAEYEFEGTEEDERNVVAEYPETYFKDGINQQTKKPVRLKCFPQKPVQAVAVAIDFPEIQVDKGQFFGDSKPLPLRLWLGGQFYHPSEKKMVIAQPTFLKVNKKLGGWSFDQKHLFYKMAVAAKLIKPGEVFVPQDIDKLLGQAFQFEAQVFFKAGKDGKKYYTEYIKFVSGLGRGQKAPECPVIPAVIQMTVKNDEQAVKEVRSHVLNTCRLASNWQGSALQKQVDELRSSREESAESEPKSVNKPTEKSLPDDFDDDSIPF